MNLNRLRLSAAILLAFALPASAAPGQKEWVFKSPEAQLMDDAGKVVGKAPAPCAAADAGKSARFDYTADYYF